MGIAKGAVRKKAKGIIVDTWQSQANLSLFLVMQVLIAFVLPAMGFGRDDARLYSDIGFSILLISGVAIAWGRREIFALTVVVGTVTLFMRWLALWRLTPTISLWSDWCSLVAVIMISLVLLTQIFRHGRVTRVRIQGAIAVYLLFGVGWAHAYHITALLHPGSFTFPAGEIPGVGDWIYFSFVTLTTVGYGDITPVLPTARTLATAEALAGQLYLAVMIARLVAMEMVFWQQKAMEDLNS
jgi:hypothetical protein